MATDAGMSRQHHAGTGHGGAAGGHAGHDGDHTAHHAAMIADFRRRFWASMLLTVPILALSPLIQSTLGLREALAFAGEGYILFALSALVFFYGGWPFLTGFRDELGRGEPGMMTLIALAIGVAFLYSSAVVFGLAGKVFFWELATLIDVMLLGHWIEMRSVMGASGALQSLVRLMPSEAHRLTGSGATEEVTVDALVAGERVLVKPGEKVPTDGVIVDGTSSFNEAMLTGESTPVRKGEGEEVIGGAVNGEEAVTVEVARTGAETYLSQVVEMVRKAQESRSHTQDMADTAARWLAYIALTAGGLTLAAWLSLGRDFEFSLERMVTVMVITCPHALGLAVPLVVAISTSMGANSGLLIRDRAAFERARSLDAVLFDKTGTLTEGRFGVQEVASFDGREESEVLRLAAGLESASEHPIARGIVADARERGLEPPAAEGFRNLTGRGAEARVDGRRLRVVSPAFAAEQGIEVDAAALERLGEGGNTVVVVVEEEQVIGAIALADVVRETSREAVQALKGMGVRCMMLTGDGEAVAARVAAELGLDEYFAGVLPDQKAAKVEEVRARGLRVAMVGDGVNDAPALVAADLGVAIGAGTDVAIESADLVLVKNDPAKVVAAIHLSRATYGKMLQNLAWATGYNVVAIPLAAGVAAGAGILLSPAVGAALMSASTVIVAFNARLLRRSQPA